LPLQRVLAFPTHALAPNWRGARLLSARSPRPRSPAPAPRPAARGARARSAAFRGAAPSPPRAALWAPRRGRGLSLPSRPLFAEAAGSGFARWPPPCLTLVASSFRRPLPAPGRALPCGSACPSAACRPAPAACAAVGPPARSAPLGPGRARGLRAAPLPSPLVRDSPPGWGLRPAHLRPAAGFLVLGAGPLAPRPAAAGRLPSPGASFGRWWLLGPHLAGLPVRPPRPGRGPAGSAPGRSRLPFVPPAASSAAWFFSSRWRPRAAGHPRLHAPSRGCGRAPGFAAAFPPHSSRPSGARLFRPAPELRLTGLRPSLCLAASVPA